VHPEQLKRLGLDRALADVAKAQRLRNTESLRSVSIPLDKHVELLTDLQRKELINSARKAAETLRPEVEKALEASRLQQMELLREASTGLDLMPIVRAATEQLRLANEPTIKQATLTALQSEAVRVAARAASREAAAAVGDYDWRSLSQQLSKQAAELLAEIGAEDRLTELHETALEQIAAAREEAAAGEAETAREAHGQPASAQEVVEAINELMDVIRSEDKATRAAVAKSSASNAVQWIGVVIALAAFLVSIASLLTEQAALREQRESPPAIVIPFPRSWRRTLSRSRTTCRPSPRPIGEPAGKLRVSGTSDRGRPRGQKRESVGARRAPKRDSQRRTTRSPLPWGGAFRLRTLRSAPDGVRPAIDEMKAPRRAAGDQGHCCPAETGHAVSRSTTSPCRRGRSPSPFWRPLSARE
jgi:hypothetical protein